MEGFVMTAATADIYYRYCRRYNIETEKDKTEVLRRLVTKKKAKYLRNPQEFISKHKTLYIKRKENPDGKQ